MNDKVHISHNLTLALFLILCLTGDIRAQSKRDTKRKLVRVNDSTEVRQSFEQRQADGLKVTIYQATADGMVPVDPKKAFKSGDRFRLKLESNFNGYVYVINVPPVGENRLLFPRGVSRRNNIRAGQSYDIPTKNDFEFEAGPGIEILRILMSRTSVSVLEAALDRAPRQAAYVPLDATTTQSLEQLIGKPARSRSSGISTQTTTRKSGIQTRKLTLDRKKETTFVVVSGGKGIPSQFQPGEISVFEIRLNHL